MSNPRHDRKDNQHSGHLKKEIRSDSFSCLRSDRSGKFSSEAAGGSAGLRPKGA